MLSFGLMGECTMEKKLEIPFERCFFLPLCPEGVENQNFYYFFWKTFCISLFKVNYRLVTFHIEIPLITNLTYSQMKFNEQKIRFLGYVPVFLWLLL